MKSFILACVVFSHLVFSLPRYDQFSNDQKLEGNQTGFSADGTSVHTEKFDINTLMYIDGNTTGSSEKGLQIMVSKTKSSSQESLHKSQSVFDWLFTVPNSSDSQPGYTDTPHDTTEKFLGNVSDFANGDTESDYQEVSTTHHPTIIDSTPGYEPTTYETSKATHLKQNSKAASFTPNLNIPGSLSGHNFGTRTPSLTTARPKIKSRSQININAGVSLQIPSSLSSKNDSSEEKLTNSVNLDISSLNDSDEFVANKDVSSNQTEFLHTRNWDYLNAHPFLKDAFDLNDTEIFLVFLFTHVFGVIFLTFCGYCIIAVFKGTNTLTAASNFGKTADQFQMSF